MATDVEAATAGTPVKSVPRVAQFRALFEEVITFQVTLDEDSIAAAKASQADITVPGARLGDFVLVASASDLVYQLLTAKVKSADTVTLSILNQDSTDASTSSSAAPVLYGIVLKRNQGAWASN